MTRKPAPRSAVRYFIATAPDGLPFRVWRCSMPELALKLAETATREQNPDLLRQLPKIVAEAGGAYREVGFLARRLGSLKGPTCIVDAKLKYIDEMALGDSVVTRWGQGGQEGQDPGEVMALEGSDFEEGMSVDCDSHGSSPWTGQVICVNCGAVWHLNHENPPTEDGKCTCGFELMGKDGSARAICPGCYKGKKEQAAGPPS